MKTCSKCNIEKEFHRYAKNDYDKYVSRCKDCESAAVMARYNLKKEKVLAALSEVGTDNFTNENEYKKEIKCKSFFFYQHV
jgi:NAD-dependent SIR2 family protein deacetylase